MNNSPEVRSAVERTDKAIQDHEQGTKRLPWNRRMTLKLLRREAEETLRIGEDSEPAKKEPEKEATILSDDPNAVQQHSPG
jgi:hypothetical protein